MTRHLGEEAGAFVDGALEPAKYARAWTHYRTCSFCRDVVAGQREVRGELRKLHHSMIPPDILNGLFAIASDEGAITAVGHTRPAPTARRGLARVNAGRLRMVGVVGAVACAVVSGLWVLGGGFESTPGVLDEARTATEQFRLDRLAEPDAAGLGGAEQVSLESIAWLGDGRLPQGFTVAEVEVPATAEADLAAVEIVTPSGPIWLSARHGHLDDADLGELTKREVEGHAVYDEVVEGRMSGVWETDDYIIAFVSEASDEALGAIVRETPEGSDAASFPERLSRGWKAITSALS